MDRLPVRQMVLYKHGVGFFTRAGEIESDSITLTFRKDEINDVLKSLAVFDRAGAQILSVHYQTPMDYAARLASSSIKLGQHDTLLELLQQCRGRQVMLGFAAADGSTENLRGRIVGYTQGETPTISLLEAGGELQVVPFDKLRSISLRDAQAQHDLTYFLDTSMAEADRRSVTVRLAPLQKQPGADAAPKHNLVAYYIAPTPVWRVSYRLFADLNDAQTGGTALLQGWALFDNRLDEDLENVRLTLVAGQPISFIYDLYASRIPQRPLIHDAERIAPGPIEYSGATMGGAMAMADEAEALDGMPDWLSDQAEAEPLAFRAMAAPAAPPRARRAQMQGTTAKAETRETGATFQYVVPTAVTVKRGESALVPIIGATINYERELLYNATKFPDHPVAALRFTNNSGLTLERGPITLVEDGDYRGEAVIPFTKQDGTVYLPYAVELGIRIVERNDARDETHGLSIENDLIVFETYRIRTHTHVIENNTPNDQIVTLERATPSGNNTQLYQTPQPDAETATEQRWQVMAEKRARTEFRVMYRTTMQRTQQLRSLKYQQLSDYLKNQWIDDNLYTRIKGLLDLLAFVEEQNRRINRLNKEREGLYSKQEQLRKNLGALQTQGKEAPLRDRILTQLSDSQDRLEGIDKELDDAANKIKEAERRVEQVIDVLNK